MKNIFLLLLMVLLPLQSLWAAGQAYHMLEEGHANGPVTVLHNHAYQHQHDHEHEHGHNGEALNDHHSNSDSSSESDHHHHCTGHGAVVLPSLLTDLQPDLRYDEFSPEPILATSYLNTRIERPNWY